MFDSGDMFAIMKSAFHTPEEESRLSVVAIFEFQLNRNYLGSGSGQSKHPLVQFLIFHCFLDESLH